MKKIMINNIEKEKEELDFGDESLVYKLQGRNKVYKEWNIKNSNNDELFKTISNKVRKLEKIEQKESLFKYIVKPKELVKNYSSYTGYTMEHYDGSKLDKYLNYKDTIILLKKIKEALLELKKNDILYFDLNCSNILYIKEKDYLDFKIIDIDNSIVEDREMDLYPPFLLGYLSKGGKLDRKALIFAYNHLTVSLLDRFDRRLSPNPDIASYNRKIAKFGELSDRPIVDSIIDNEYLIDLYDENKYIKSPLL